MPYYLQPTTSNGYTSRYNREQPRFNNLGHRFLKAPSRNPRHFRQSSASDQGDRRENGPKFTGSARSSEADSFHQINIALSEVSLIRSISLYVFMYITNI